MADRDKYTIGWICACDIEFTAALACFDRRHSDPDFVVKNDPNIYALGKMHGHNVVIATRRDGDYGRPSHWCPVNVYLVRSFPNVRCGLSVGLGGGAPTLKHDVQLGDVVVGEPNDLSSGVVPYNIVKTILTKTFAPEGSLNMAPRELRDAQEKLFLEQRLHGSQVVDIAIEAIQKTKQPEVYARPSTKIRRHTDSLCKVHYGLIASGHKLMENDQVRNAVAVQNDVLCFETEAFKILNDFPCLVIRGICDFAGEKKTTKWRGWAAMMAAVYAKCVLKHLDTESPQSRYRNLSTRPYAREPSAQQGQHHELEIIPED